METDIHGDFGKSVNGTSEVSGFKELRRFRGVVQTMKKGGFVIHEATLSRNQARRTQELMRTMRAINFAVEGQDLLVYDFNRQPTPKRTDEISDGLQRSYDIEAKMEMEWIKGRLRLRFRAREIK